MPTKDRILLWATLIILLLAILTTPPSLTWPSYFFQLVAACVFVAGSDTGPKVLDIMVGH